MEELIKEGERLDDLELDSLKIIQNPEKFCFGIDAVLLSSFAKVKKKEQVLDIGTGTGIIPILLSAKTKAAHIKAVEIQADMADMARRSVLYNKLEDRIEVICGDIKEVSTGIKKGSIDVIVSNPPYIKLSHALVNPEDSLALARHEISCSLDEILKISAELLRVQGRIYMIHKAHRLTEIIHKMSLNRLEVKRLRMIHSYKEQKAKMVLIEGVKLGNPWLDIEKPLIIYDSPGAYSKEIKQIYGKAD